MWLEGKPKGKPPFLKRPLRKDAPICQSDHVAAGSVARFVQVFNPGTPLKGSIFGLPLKRIPIMESRDNTFDVDRDHGSLTGNPHNGLNPRTC